MSRQDVLSIEIRCAGQPHLGNRLLRKLRLMILVAAITPAVLTAGAASAKPPNGSGEPDFGPDVMIFDPGMPTSQIQAAVDLLTLSLDGTSVIDHVVNNAGASTGTGGVPTNLIDYPKPGDRHPDQSRIGASGSTTPARYVVRA